MQIKTDLETWIRQNVDINAQGIKHEIVQRFNIATSQSLDSENLTLAEERSVLQWLFQNAVVFFTRSSRICGTQTWFLNEVEKNNFLKGPDCLKDFIQDKKETPLRLPPLSRQSDVESRRWLRELIKNHPFIKGKNVFTPTDRIYLKLVFTIRESHDKDVDNMAKEVIDALKGELFPDDKQIDHLEVIKFKTEHLEENIMIRVGYSSINDHSNVIFREINLNWAGQPKMSRKKRTE